MSLTPPQYKQMKQFLESDQRNKKTALLQDDLEPGPLKDELKGTFDPTQETYEEYLRRINLAGGGRIGFRKGTPIEEYSPEIQQRIKDYGIKKYNKLNNQQKYDIRNPKRRTKDFNFKFKGKTISVKGFGIKESSAKNIQDLLKILEKNPNITPEQWFAKTSKATGSAGGGLYQISQDLLKYVKGDFDKIKGATSKKIFDELNIKNLIKDEIPNLKNISGKTFRQSVATAERSKQAVTNTFEAVKRLNQEFKLDPDIELDELAERLYGKGASQSVPLMNQTRNDVTRYVEVLRTGTRKNLNIPNFKYPSANQAADILDSIAEKSGDFGFNEGMIRDLKFNIRDDLLKLKKGTTRNLRTVLSNLIKGKGNVIDEAVGLSATFEDAPGYTEATQVIKNKYNKRKGFLIDRPFSALIKKIKNNSATAKEINDFNTISKRFSKETGVDSPIIKIGKNLNPEKFVKSFKDYSPEAQANIRELAKKNNFVIQTKSEPLKNVVSSFRPQVSTPNNETKKIIATLSNDPRCSRGFKNQGGRVGLQDGSASLNVCFRQGIDNINRGLPNPTAAQARNFGKVAALGRGVLKFGVLPEALFVAGESVIRMGMGDSLPEAILRASEYLLPGNQTKLADRMMLARTVGPKTAELILKANELRGFEDRIQNLENEKQFTGILTDDGFDDNFFGQTKVEEENVIQKQIDALKKRRESYGALTEAQYQFADMQAQEAEDIKKSGALFPKLLAKARSVDIASDDPLAEGIKKTMDLDLKMLPSRFERQTNLEVRKPMYDRLVNTTNQELSNLFTGEKLENILRDKKYIQGYREETVSEAAALNPEAMFSASTGLFFGEPLDKGVSYTPPPIDTITEMEREITGQTNVANPFDIDRSSVATGLRGFAAAGGGIAKLAGKPSGPPPTSGPTSQGLPGLLKRDRRI
jgi:hypothetical protein